MKIFLTTFYFDHIILTRRPYVSLDICIKIIAEPIYSENQHDGRIRYWGIHEGRYLRVVTLEDGLTIHNAFFDRNFDLSKRGHG